MQNNVFLSCILLENALFKLFLMGFLLGFLLEDLELFFNLGIGQLLWVFFLV